MKILDLEDYDKKGLLQLKERVMRSDADQKTKEVNLENINKKLGLVIRDMEKEKQILKAIEEGKADVSDMNNDGGLR
jgi:hypothetical protein